MAQNHSMRSECLDGTASLLLLGFKVPVMLWTVNGAYFLF